MSRIDIGLWDVADLLPGAILLVDLQGEVLGSNRAARRLLGLDTPCPGLQLESLLAAPAGKLSRYLESCAGSRHAMPGSFSLLAGDGEARRCTVSGSRVGETPDRLILLRLEAEEASAHDRFVTLNETIEELRQQVRARRRAEALLEAEKETLSRIVAGAPLEDALETLCRAIEQNAAGMLVSILLLDDEGRLRHAAAPSLPERYSAAIDGVAAGPDVGSCGTAAHTGEMVVVSDIATDRRWADYREMALRDGLAACWSTPIRASTGDILGTLALYYRSVREPSDAELQLIENSAHIASLAIERHRSQDALAKLLAWEQGERERVESESRAKDRFLAMLSHELRNPLGAVANAAHALDALGGNDETRSELQGIILAESGMLKRILDDLLDVSRLDSGKLALKVAPVDIAQLIGGLAASFCAAHPECTLTFDCDDDVGWVDGDRTRLQQIVQNLLDNAFKYSGDDDEVTLTVSRDDDAVRVSVRDTGEGIEPAIMPDIFDPFIQSDVSLERTGSGLGLGLALVRQLTDMHGGTIEARSDGAGRGSEFILRLPRIAAPVQESAPAAPLSEEPRRRVLVVEDNAGAREGLCRLLELWGHEVTSAEDGEEALDLMRTDPPDVALVDIGLPRMDGYALARAIRDHPPGARIKLVALTGYGQEQDRRRADEAGFELHLVKPVDVSDLRKVFTVP